MKKVMNAAIASAVVFSMVIPQHAFAASATLAAEVISCGGLVSLEKNAQGSLALRVQLSDESQCKLLQIDSQRIAVELNDRITMIPLDGRTLGHVLPMTANQQIILMRLNHVQDEIASSQTPEQIHALREQEQENAARREAQAKADEEERQRQQELAAREARAKARRRAAVAGAAVIIGGAAVAGSAVVKQGKRR